MSYQTLIQVLKGSARSGNWGHDGRPGLVGGSTAGAGFGRIGVDRSADLERIRRSSLVIRTRRGFSDGYGVADQLAAYYNLEDNCGVKWSCEAVQEYTSMAYSDINSQLRKGYDLGKEGIIAEMDEFFKQMPPLPENVLAHRRMAAGVLQDLQPGDEFQDKGFVSTTVVKDAAMSSYAGYVEIRIPAGAKASFVREISDFRSEQELLLPRGSRFRVLDKVQRGYEVLTVMELIVDEQRKRR